MREILARDDRDLPDAAWHWVRRSIRYHPERPEVVADLPRLIAYPVGDCDDMAVALATLLLAGQIPARWVIGWADEGRGLEPVHIWAEALVRRDGQVGWYPLDPVAPVDAPGTHPTQATGVPWAAETAHPVE